MNHPDADSERKNAQNSKKKLSVFRVAVVNGLHAMIGLVAQTWLRIRKNILPETETGDLFTKTP